MYLAHRHGIEIEGKDVLLGLDIIIIYLHSSVELCTKTCIIAHCLLFKKKNTLSNLVSYLDKLNCSLS